MKSILLLVVSIALASCADMAATTQFKQYYGPNIFPGGGGTKVVIDGMDVWENGQPNRQFQLLGYIYDSVHEVNGAAPHTLDISSVSSFLALKGRQQRLVAEAKREGGDAIIYATANRSFQNATGYQTRYSNQVGVAVVKYL